MGVTCSFQYIYLKNHLSEFKIVSVCAILLGHIKYNGPSYRVMSCFFVKKEEAQLYGEAITFQK